MSSLSIVMPCLNAARTIGRSLDSIRERQPAGVEVVVADGGSTDGTLDVLRERGDVQWHSEPDAGLSDAYNKGAARATGDVLGWLNADDAYVPGALARVQEAFAAEPTLTWLTGRCSIVDGGGRTIRTGVTRYKDALLSRYSHPLHLTQNFISAPSTFFRRDAFERLGGLDRSLRYSMDYDLYLRLGRESRPAVLDQPLAIFTMTEGTLSMSGFQTQFVEHQQVAARYRSDAPAAYAVNVVASRAIVLAYRSMRLARQARAGQAKR